MVTQGSEEVISMLVGLGADVHARDSFGRTPLFYAGRKATPVLLAAGAEVDARDFDHMTAINFIARNDRISDAILEQRSELGHCVTRASSRKLRA